MASFIGNNLEFRRYIGPRLRNLVQQITKTHKAEVANCEHCGSTQNLESAHVAGRDRNQIIDFILEQFLSRGIVTVDIDVFEEIFKKEHHPIEKCILILCRTCHKKYDAPRQSKVGKSADGHTGSAATSRAPQDSAVILPIALFPSDLNTFKNELLQSRVAEIEITYSDGSKQTRAWHANQFSKSSHVMGNLRSRPEFRSGKWQTNGISRIAVRVKNRA